jgi:crossover junction endodeoxyribonuclease RusA
MDGADCRDHRAGDGAVVTFTVYGTAQPKGSMRAFIPRGMKFPIVTDSNRNAKSWAQLVAQGASQALTERGIASLQVGPMRVTAAFYLPRPKKYHRRGVPVAHLCAPDLDKLLRSVLDALTRVVYHDDSQVVEILALKRYADVDAPPRVQITVEPTTGTRPVIAPPVPMPLFESECV